MFTRLTGFIAKTPSVATRPPTPSWQTRLARVLHSQGRGIEEVFLRI